MSKYPVKIIMIFRVVVVWISANVGLCTGYILNGQDQHTKLIIYALVLFVVCIAGIAFIARS